jgi:hypothetical protein
MQGSGLKNKNCYPLSHFAYSKINLDGFFLQVGDYFAIFAICPPVVAVVAVNEPVCNLLNIFGINRFFDRPAGCVYFSFACLEQAAVFIKKGAVDHFIVPVIFHTGWFG